MNTKLKGDIALSQAVAYFVLEGYEVLLPLGDRSDYDCVVERDGVLKRVQVKYAGKYKTGQCKVGLRVTGGNRSRNFAKKYSDTAFDILFIFSEDGIKYLIPWHNIRERNELTIGDKKYIKYQV